MPSKEAEMINQVFRMMPKNPPDKKHDYAAERKENEKRPIPELPEGVTLEEAEFDGISGEILRSDGAGDVVIWYLHGGGFTTGSARERRDITQYLAQTYPVTVIATNYRLSPEDKWPAHLDDCMKVYDELLRQGYDPKKMIFMGESAGGTLVLSMGLRLAMEKKEQPAVIVAFSPCTEQAEGLPSHTENVETDYMLRDGTTRPEQYEAVFGISDRMANVEMLKDPLISPYYGNYSGLPPIFLAASDTEVLADDSRYLYRRLKDEGHAVELDIQHEVCHAYPMLPMMPEARETIQKAMDFAMETMQGQQG